MTYSTSIRFTKGDEELKQYLINHGIKPGIVKLFEFYKLHQDQSNFENSLLSKIKDMMGNNYQPPSQQTTQDKKVISRTGLSLLGSIKAK